jgi:drug/metabolite transporter (DMT)-like permease
MVISTRALAYFGMIFVVLFWGLAWPVGKLIVLDMQDYVFTAAFLRFTFALPVLGLITYFKEKNLSIPIDLHKKVAVLGILQISLYNFLYLTGLIYTSSSDAALIIAINPTITAIFASIVYQDEKISWSRLVGLSLAFTGVFLIFLYSPNIDTPNRLLGNLIIFGAALVWATYTTFSRPVYQRISVFKFQFWASFYGWILLGIIALFEQPWNHQFQGSTLFYIFYLGVFAAAIANSLFSQGIKIIGPTKTSVFVNFIPLVGVIFSIILLSDKFSWIYIASFVLIFSGVRIVNKSKSKIYIKEASEENQT